MHLMPSTNTEATVEIENSTFSLNEILVLLDKLPKMDPRANSPTISAPQQTNEFRQISFGASTSDGSDQLGNEALSTPFFFQEQVPSGMGARCGPTVTGASSIEERSHTTPSTNMETMVETESSTSLLNEFLDFHQTNESRQELSFHDAKPRGSDRLENDLLSRALMESIYSQARVPSGTRLRYDTTTEGTRHPPPSADLEGTGLAAETEKPISLDELPSPLGRKLVALATDGPDRLRIDAMSATFIGDFLSREVPAGAANGRKTTRKRKEPSTDRKEEPDAAHKRARNCEYARKSRQTKKQKEQLLQAELEAEEARNERLEREKLELSTIRDWFKPFVLGRVSRGAQRRNLLAEEWPYPTNIFGHGVGAYGMDVLEAPAFIASEDSPVATRQTNGNSEATNPGVTGLGQAQSLSSHVPLVPLHDSIQGAYSNREETRAPENEELRQMLLSLEFEGIQDMDMMEDPTSFSPTQLLARPEPPGMDVATDMLNVFDPQRINECIQAISFDALTSDDPDQLWNISMSTSMIGNIQEQSIELGISDMLKMEYPASFPPVLSLPEPRDALTISPSGLALQLAGEIGEEFTFDSSVLDGPEQLGDDALSRVESLGVQNEDHSGMEESRAIEIGTNTRDELLVGNKQEEQESDAGRKRAKAREYSSRYRQKKKDMEEKLKEDLEKLKYGNHQLEQENQALKRENQALERENQALEREKQALEREKQALERENQALKREKQAPLSTLA
ncbi:unnamed protein product [Darwinula stevensoni]|uniref:BZIP domain-containing protein n=1 Tax=Darwinula stevensoni TaxID=69355 RepID=A0A7R8X9X9_9CRUS|nr:unnamed protein product [Darwinula stevensoni]CAG0886089.1 unnamed protein product [Darwinula stevensoni]